VLAQGEDIVPIPGPRRRRNLEDNVGALDVVLTLEDRRRIDELLPRDAVAGERYAPAFMARPNR
jgi:aryl-alcohol dehydrogenase-like predicted oxidoreductase